jgi:hypothetical protein
LPYALANNPTQLYFWHPGLTIICTRTGLCIKASQQPTAHFSHKLYSPLIRLSKFTGDLANERQQDWIVQQNFTYYLPKSIQDKLVESLPKIPDEDNKKKINKNGGKGGGKLDAKNEITSLKDIVIDPDPSHMRWRIK